jgi:hypothetical protein
MKTKSKTSGYIVHSIVVAALVLTAQVSLAASAIWLSSPQDSAWENPNNWTAGGPPNGPSDVATFAQSSRTSVNITTSEEVNSIEFTSAQFFLYIFGGELTISGTGIENNSSFEHLFTVGSSSNFVHEGGQLIFNNTSTAADTVIRNYWGSFPGGQTIFNDTSRAGGASITNFDAAPPDVVGQTIFNGASSADHAAIANVGSGLQGLTPRTTFNGKSTAANAYITNWGGFDNGEGGETIFNDSSTAGSATMVNNGGSEFGGFGGATIFADSSTADSAILGANGVSDGLGGGAIIFSGTSTGGIAQVNVLNSGYLDISDHNRGVTIGSIAGSGNAFLGANRLTVGTNNLDTSFSGVISNDGHGGSLAKVGSGVLTLKTNHSIADTIGLFLVDGSIINLDFAGPPDVIASLTVNGVPQAPGIYGGRRSGAPHTLPEFGDGLGTVEAGPLSTLGNISTRAFVETDDNVMIGGFIVQGAEPKRVVIRAIGPELTQHGVPDAMANPRLELHDGTGILIASNDNWVTTIIGGIIIRDHVAAIRDTGYAPSDLMESAMIVNLPPGNYTAIVRGVGNKTGVALVEVYDLTPAPDSLLGNISTRSFVQTGDNVMIGGVIVQGTQPTEVIVRAIGPELTQYGVPRALADPTLELYDSTGALIASNDNWQHTIIGGIITSDQVAVIRASGHAPDDPRESAIIANLPPGNYTAIVRGVNNTTGVGLVEVYDLD